MKDELTLLHVHTAKGSLLDSMIKVKDLVQFAKNNGQSAIAVTDHGTMSSFVDLYKECKKQDIKPIYGCEVYETDDMTIKNDTKENKQPRYHLILLAKNKTGLLNLFKIVSAGYMIGFYTKPRIDLEYIEKNKLGEGIICLTACMAGRLSKILLGEATNKYNANEYINKLKTIFDYVACEIQAHNNNAQQMLNNKILDFANKNNLPYVVTTDAHMIKKEDQEVHEIFVKIGDSREVGEIYEGCYLQTTEDIYNNLDTINKEYIAAAIKETQHINSMIDSDIDIGYKQGNQMPIIKCPEGFNDNLEYMKYLINRDFDKRFNYCSKEEKEIRRKRIFDIEIPVLAKLGYIDYFLMLVKLIKKAKDRNMPIGFSRGSGGNCENLYALGITQIDSVKWKLDFSRFANLGRQSPADYDMDISQRRRREMVDIAGEEFGFTNVAPICTYNMITTKVAIRDIGKVLDEKGIYNIPFSLRNKVSNLIPTIKTLNDLGEEGEEKDALLKDVLNNNTELKKINDQYPLWFKYVMEIEGLPKSLGRHACGNIISPHPILDYCPVCLDSDKNKMLQIEMHNAMDDLNLVKMDFLGLKTLDIIDDTLKYAGLKWEDVDINHINLNDKYVYDNIYKKGKTIGVFQMESAEAIKMCIKSQADNIEDVIAINAFNRPGTKDGFPIYCENKLHPEQATILHEDLRPIFNSTHLVLLYQEQALQIFRLAGFPEDQVDNARRAIGHKEKETMVKLKTQFIEGMEKRNWTMDQINEIWALMAKQAKYCFNRGHSVAYGLLSYLTAYLKYYYPVEFMTACLNSDIGNTGKTSVFLNECNRLGIKVTPPNVNKSMKYYTPDTKNKEIIFGLYPIKDVGEEAANFVIQNRPYKNFKDFLDKMTIKGSPINKKGIIALIKSGAIPYKHGKNHNLKLYAQYCKKPYNFLDVKSANLKILRENGIDTTIVKDKAERLKLYNNIRKQKYEVEYTKYLQKYYAEFKEKYVGDSKMYELNTLNMFITENPFAEVQKYLTDIDKIDEGADCVVIAAIVDIKRKKDRHNNQFAYLDLYTYNGIIEAIAWSSTYNKYQDYISKGNTIAILGEKQEDKIIAKKFKTFEQWKIDYQKLRHLKNK